MPAVRSRQASGTRPRSSARGDRMTVYINGMLQNECSGTDRTGYIALQSEGGTLEFRNVYLTDVK